jgi:6-phosphofructokinase 1
MRIGILTGGGDVPGLNPCVKTVVYGAIERNWQVVGIRRGWAGMLELDPTDPASLGQGTLELNRQNTRTIDRSGGTFLHTSRLNPARLRREQLPAALAAADLPTTPDGWIDCTRHVLSVVDWLGLDVLVPIGGDETLGFAQRLSAQGVPIVAVPKTMDNDVFGTDYCLGFSTAVSRSVQFINQIRTSAGSHERIALVELLGGHCGETSLLASYLAGADRVLIPEVAFDLPRLAELLAQDKRANPSNYAVVTVSEGARPAGVAPEPAADAADSRVEAAGIGHRTALALQRALGEEVLEQQVGYLMRSGAPDGLDLMVADNFAALTLQLIEQDASGRMVALRNGTYATVPLEVVLEGTKRVDVPELYDPERYLPRVRHVEGKPMFLY